MADRRLVDELTASLRLPVMVAPMFLISGPDLVIAAG
jgi:nitronate monooxygenase